MKIKYNTPLNFLFVALLAGLIAGTSAGKKLSTPYFDNVLIKGINATVPAPSSAAPDQSPIYGISNLTK